MSIVITAILMQQVSGPSAVSNCSDDVTVVPQLQTADPLVILRATSIRQL